MKDVRDIHDRGLTPELLLRAYRSGFFPMAESRDGPIHWYSPEPRGIIPLEAFHVPRTLRRVVRSGRYVVRCDTLFERVILECAAREETWISEDIIRVYTELHRTGYAHSVEAWEEEMLAGGLYGVALGRVFFGESMFSRHRDASKIALVHLVRRLLAEGYGLIDCQMHTPHLASLGAIELPRAEFARRLKDLVDYARPPGPWRGERQDPAEACRN